MRLCRIVREPAVWACLAALALQGADLECAELCLAAIDEVDKLHFVQARTPGPDAMGESQHTQERNICEQSAFLARTRTFLLVSGETFFTLVSQESFTKNYVLNILVFFFFASYLSAFCPLPLLPARASPAAARATSGRAGFVPPPPGAGRIDPAGRTTAAGVARDRDESEVLCALSV